MRLAGKCHGNVNEPSLCTLPLLIKLRFLTWQKLARKKEIACVLSGSSPPKHLQQAFLHAECLTETLPKSRFFWVKPWESHSHNNAQECHSQSQQAVLGLDEPVVCFSIGRCCIFIQSAAVLHLFCEWFICLEVQFSTTATGGTVGLILHLPFWLLKLLN